MRRSKWISCGRCFDETVFFGIGFGRGVLIMTVWRHIVLVGLHYPVSRTIR